MPISRVRDLEFPRAERAISELRMALPMVQRSRTGRAFVVANPLASRGTVAAVEPTDYQEVIALHLGVQEAQVNGKRKTARHEGGLDLLVSTKRAGEIIATACFGDDQNIPEVLVLRSRALDALGTRVIMSSVAAKEDLLSVHFDSLAASIRGGGHEDGFRQAIPADAVRLAILLHWLNSVQEV